MALPLPILLRRPFAFHDVDDTYSARGRDDLMCAVVDQDRVREMNALSLRSAI